MAGEREGHTDSLIIRASEEDSDSGSPLLRAEDGGSDLRTACDGVSLLGAEVTQDVRRLPLTRVVDPWTSCRQTGRARQLRLLRSQAATATNSG